MIAIIVILYILALLLHIRKLSEELKTYKLQIRLYKAIA